MASTARTQAIVRFEDSPPFGSIGDIREVRKQHIDKLATNPPEPLRARYERAIKNIETSIAQWKAANPDLPDPNDEDAWAKHVQDRRVALARRTKKDAFPSHPQVPEWGEGGLNHRRPPEWIAKQEEINRRHRDNVVVSLVETSEQAAISALQRKHPGVSREQAESLVKFYRGDGLHDHVRIFCEKFTEREATAEAERLIPRSGELVRAGTSAGTSATGATAPDEQPTKITATPFLFRNPNLIPPRDFLYDDHIIRRYVSGVVSMGGVGKTSEVQAEVAAMVTGRNLLGIKPKRPYRVWYINLEDPRDEIERRMAAIFKHYGITEKDLGDRLFTDSGRDTNLVIARDSRNGIEFDQQILANISETIQANQIDLVVVDPFVNCARFAENDNNKMAAIIEAWAQIAEEQACAVVLVHHVRKGSAGHDGFTIEDARGAIALINSCRSVRVLNVMSKDEGKRAGGIERHRSYFRIDSGKANLAPAPEESQWRKIVSVDLGNAIDDCPADRIGVVTPWEWPDPLANLTVRDVIAAQKAVSQGGPWRKDSQAKDWVGKPIAEALKLDLDSQADAAKVKGALKAWLASGALKEIEKDDDKRRARKCIVVGQWANDGKTTVRMKSSHKPASVKSDDLHYTGPIVDVADLGPDPFDDHGVPKKDT
jgi:hypothetical protein